MEKSIYQIVQDAEDTITNVIYQLNTDRINYRNNITKILVRYQSKLIKEYEKKLNTKKEDLKYIDENIIYLNHIVTRLISINKFNGL